MDAPEPHSPPSPFARRDAAGFNADEEVVLPPLPPDVVAAAAPRDRNFLQQGRRMDIVVHAGAHEWWLDVSVTTSAGNFAQITAEKWKHYEPFVRIDPAVRFAPLVFHAAGACSDAARKTLHSLFGIASDDPDLGRDVLRRAVCAVVSGTGALCAKAESFIARGRLRGKTRAPGAIGAPAPPSSSLASSLPSSSPSSRAPSVAPPAAGTQGSGSGTPPATPAPSTSAPRPSSSPLPAGRVSSVASGLPVAGSSASGPSASSAAPSLPLVVPPSVSLGSSASARAASSAASLPSPAPVRFPPSLPPPPPNAQSLSSTSASSSPLAVFRPGASVRVPVRENPVSQASALPTASVSATGGLPPLAGRSAFASGAVA